MNDDPTAHIKWLEQQNAGLCKRVGELVLFLREVERERDELRARLRGVTKMPEAVEPPADNSDLF